MTDSLTTLEAEVTAAGHELERTYEFGGQDTRDGDGWVVRVGGQLVATGGSVGTLEGRLREWWNSKQERSR